MLIFWNAKFWPRFKVSIGSYRPTDGIKIFLDILSTQWQNVIVGYAGVLFVKGHGLPLSKSKLTFEFTVLRIAFAPTNVMLLPQFDGSFESLWQTVETRPRPKGVVTEIRWRKGRRDMGPWLKLSFSYEFEVQRVVIQSHDDNVVGNYFLCRLSNIALSG